MITNSNLIPTQEIWQEISQNNIVNYGTFSERFANRFFRKGYAVTYVIFYIIVVIWFLFEATLLDVIWKIASLCKKHSEEEEFEKEDEWSNDFLREIDINYLYSYEDKAQDELREYTEQVNDPEQRFDSDKSKGWRFDEELKIDNNFLKQFLETRIKQIHFVIE